MTMFDVDLGGPVDSFPGRAAVPLAAPGEG
jgi:hypothetical protein